MYCSSASHDPYARAFTDGTLSPGKLDDLQKKASSCRFCTRPIRLKGEGEDTGSANEVLGPCGTRRESICPACASIYKGDARRIISAGLIGREEKEGLRALPPAIFFTLTAPSFGAVHSAHSCGDEDREMSNRRSARLCRHGISLRCPLTHEDEDDPDVSQALCPSCYSFSEAVLWNAHLGELWRRTVIFIKREIARICGTPISLAERDVVLAYVKVAEFQKRGVVHLHGVLRLDEVQGLSMRNLESSLPLLKGLELATEELSFSVPCGQGELEIRWGEQFDATPIWMEGDDEESLELNRRMVNYLAKYATKSSSENGGMDRPIRSECELGFRDISFQTYEMALVAWKLGGDPAYAHLKLRKWAHTLGFRGHFLTKTRNYSMTFGELRAIRADFRKSEAGESENQESSAFTFTGQGWPDPLTKDIVASAREVHEYNRYEYKVNRWLEEML